MLNLIGDILNLAGLTVLFPLLFVPLVLLWGNGSKNRSALLLVALPTATVSIALVFATLAVDITPPTLPPSVYGLFAAVLVIGALTLLTNGIDAVAARLSTLFDGLVKTTGRITLFFVVAMVLIQFTVVILRYVFGVNSIFAQESVTYFHGSVFLLAGGYALLTNDHVRVDIFYGSANEKRKALIDLAGTYLFLFPFCLVTLWSASEYVGNAWAAREGSTEQSGIQAIFLLKTLIPIFAFLLTLAGLRIATTAVRTLLGSRPQKGAA